MTVFCENCDDPLTAEEAYYYEIRCERCERLRFYRLQVWRAGKEDPELDALYSAPPSPQGDRQ